ncbi:hypothetical protein MKX03_010310, partial [Papaver bracteatum]
LWLVLRSYGVAGLRNFPRSHAKMAKHFEELVGMIVVPRTFSMACFRLKPQAVFFCPKLNGKIVDENHIEDQINEINRKLLESINASGDSWRCSRGIHDTVCNRCDTHRRTTHNFGLEGHTRTHRFRTPTYL